MNLKDPEKKKKYMIYQEFPKFKYTFQIMIQKEQ